MGRPPVRNAAACCESLGPNRRDACSPCLQLSGMRPSRSPADWGKRLLAFALRLPDSRFRLGFLTGLRKTRMSNPPEIPSSHCSPERGGAGKTKEQIACFLNFCLGVFVADGIISVVVGFLGIKVPGALDGVMSLFTLGVLALAFAVYCLMGLTPLVPKRFFLPLVLIYPATWLLLIPTSIFFSEHINAVLLAASFCQTALGMVILFCLRKGRTSRWQLVPVNQLGKRNFSWSNLSVFALANLALLAATILYLAFFSALAVDHFTGGFVSLRPDGLNVRIRKFIRDDKKAVWLVPMSHIGGAKYYETLSKALPQGSVVLMEGVSDRKKLLTNPISYTRAATVLGLAEQKEKFRLPGKIVRADLDVDQFSSGTIDILNVLMLPHTKGLTFETLRKLAQFKPTEEAMNQCWDDLLGKRNRNLVGKSLHGSPTPRRSSFPGERPTCREFPPRFKRWDSGVTRNRRSRRSRLLRAVDAEQL
jgi:hypothetical protein